MKITINGTPVELAKIIKLLGNDFEDEAEQSHSTLPERPKVPSPVVAFSTTPLNTPDPANGEKTQIENDIATVTGKRTRRTKEQIEADKNKVDIADQDQPEKPAKASDNDVSLDDLTTLILEKGAEGHRTKIISKLGEYGAKRGGELDPKHYNTVYVYLQSL